MAETESRKSLSIELTAEIASSYVSNNTLATSELPALITSIFGALAGSPIDEPAAALPPAVPIKKSITRDYLICLEDGRRFKSLRRHLRSQYGLSPEAYRAKWGLSEDYPMVAPAYSEARSALAKQMGLGVGGRGAAKAGSTPPNARRKRKTTAP